MQRTLLCCETSFSRDRIVETRVPSNQQSSITAGVAVTFDFVSQSDVRGWYRRTQLSWPVSKRWHLQHWPLWPAASPVVCTQSCYPPVMKLSLDIQIQTEGAFSNKVADFKFLFWSRLKLILRRLIPFKGGERAMVDQTNVGTVSKATLGKLLTDSFFFSL